MITRATFIALIEAIQRQDEHDQRIGKAVDVLSEGDHDGLNNNSFVYVTPLRDRVLEVLSAELDDKDGWINWWFFDGSDAGRKAEEYAAYTSAGEPVVIRDPGALYDWIEREKLRREGKPTYKIHTFSVCEAPRPQFFPVGVCRRCGGRMTA